MPEGLHRDLGHGLSLRLLQVHTDTQHCIRVSLGRVSKIKKNYSMKGELSGLLSNILCICVHTGMLQDERLEEFWFRFWSFPWSIVTVKGESFGKIKAYSSKSRSNSLFQIPKWFFFEVSNLFFTIKQLYWIFFVQDKCPLPWSACLKWCQVVVGRSRDCWVWQWITSGRRLGRFVNQKAVTWSWPPCVWQRWGPC